jgi:hypothetical protein
MAANAKALGNGVKVHLLQFDVPANAAILMRWMKLTEMDKCSRSLGQARWQTPAGSPVKDSDGHSGSSLACKIVHIRVDGAKENTVNMHFNSDDGFRYRTRPISPLASRL